MDSCPMDSCQWILGLTILGFTLPLLTLKPFADIHLSAAVLLDQQCLGGLWSFEGYRRELESPNSLLFALTTPRHEATVVPANTGLPANLDNRTSSACPNHPYPMTHGTTLSSVPVAGDDCLLGMVCAWEILDEVHITLLAVSPQFQGQGLGQLLLLGLLQAACQHGSKQATLEVRPSNQAALRLYQKFDFQVAGRRRQYYPDREDGLILWCAGLQEQSFQALLKQTEEQLKLRLQIASWTVECSLI